MQKSLDQKLAAIHANPTSAKDFILADAKDADMAFGLGAPGRSPERHDGEVRFKTLADYREQIRQVIGQGVVDIVLMSASTSEQLTIREGLFADSHITPAIRANDATDVHAMRGSRIPTEPARPFRTAGIDHALCGHLDCQPDERTGADLGLYSVTFNNDLQLDLETLTAYKEFREEAEQKGFRHFLEVFNPNVPGAVSAEQRPDFINDVIARTLAGVTSAGRPVFLKIAYQGPRAMEHLVRYDPHLIVGVLGGSAGTTFDAFHLLHDAKQAGARAALYGRKINNAEHQLAFIEFLRLIADDVLAPAEAVRAYHAVLEKLEIRPHRSLEDDLVLQSEQTSYGGRSTEAKPSPTRPPLSGRRSKSDSGTASQDRLQQQLDRLNRIFGK